MCVSPTFFQLHDVGSAFHLQSCKWRCEVCKRQKHKPCHNRTCLPANIARGEAREPHTHMHASNSKTIAHSHPRTDAPAAICLNQKQPCSRDTATSCADPPSAAAPAHTAHLQVPSDGFVVASAPCLHALVSPNPNTRT